MKYYNVKWLTARKNYPFRIIFEVGRDLYETRKLEFFASGKYGYAYKNMEFNGSVLSKAPIPRAKEINSNPEFEVEEISSEEFNKFWSLLVIEK